MAAEEGAGLRADFQLVQQQLLLLTQEVCAMAASSHSTAVTGSDVQRKRARLVDDSSDCVKSALDEDELLDAVFSYVGVGDYFFAACVCRRWRGRYIKLCYNKAVDKVDKLYSSAFMTAARLQLALISGLEVEQLHDYEDLAFNISRFSLQPIEALTVAKTFDMRYPDDIAVEAAFKGRLQLVQWLRERRCPWEDTKVLSNAAASGSVELLAWLHSVTAPWSDATKVDLLDEAAVYDQLDAVKWLKETAKAPWPDDMHAASIIKNASYLVVGASVARWVLARADCCWDDWDCTALAAKQYMTDSGKQLAAELFALAHQDGCPCTCEPQNM